MRKRAPGHPPCVFVGALAAAALSIQAFLPASARLQADDPTLRLPVSSSGVLTHDGWVFPHYGLTRPPENGSTPWALRRVGSRVIGGRALDVYRYAQHSNAAGVQTGTAGGFAEADLVDPLTGERVGGLSGEALDAALEADSGTCATGR